MTVQVGRDTRLVAEQARRLGVAWETIHTAVEEFERPLVDDPARSGTVCQLRVDETLYKAATPDWATQHATGIRVAGGKAGSERTRRIGVEVFGGDGQQTAGSPPESHGMGPRPGRPIPRRR